MMFLFCFSVSGAQLGHYSINHAQITVVFSSLIHVTELLRMAPKLPKLKMIVSLDEVDEEMKRVLTGWGGTHGIIVKTLQEGSYPFNSTILVLICE